MDDKRNARPVSGEIMTDGEHAAAPPRRAGERSGDVVEAEYESLASKSEPGGNASAGDESAQGDWSPRAGLDTLKRGRRAGDDNRRFERGGPIFWTMGLALVLAAFWISGGHAIMHGMSWPSGREAAAPALRIADVESRIESRGEDAYLVVDGKAVNDGDKERTLPELSIAVVDGSGQTSHYFLGTNEPSLAPGESIAFSSRLIAPKDGVKSVSVTFQETAR